MIYRHTDTDLPIEDRYPKLIRDKIPELIKQNKGLDASVKALSNDEEFLYYLLVKLVEEATELTHAKNNDNLEEELADVYEILGAILELKQLTTENIAVVQDEKRKKRGGFKKRLVMLSKP